MALMRVRNRQLLIPVALAIGLGVPAAQASTTAKAPTAQRLTGTVQTVIVERPSNRTESNDTVKVILAGNTVVPLAEGSLPTTRDGATVSVTVVPAAGGAKQVLSATTIAAPAAAAAPAAHRLYVALVVPRGVTSGTPSAATARATVARVSRYWSAQTGGQVSFVASQVLAYRSAYTCASFYDLWAEGRARMPQASGPGRHLVVVVPGGAQTQGCPYGLGTVGAVDFYDNRVLIAGVNQSQLAHELGHNLGLYHANSLRCTGAQDRPMLHRGFPGCQAKSYDDLFDVMGFSGASYGEGNLNAVHLDGMRLLPGAVLKIPAGSGVTTVRIAPLSSTAAGRTLKITDASGARYFVEYRTNSGRDAVAGVNPYRPAWGVRVLREDPMVRASGGSYELDATPSSLASDYDRSIPVGRVFTAASRKLTIKVTAADPAGATLTIASWTAAVVPSTATLSLPARAWVGAAVTASTRVTNSHGLAVARWPVTLQKRQRHTLAWKPVRTLTTSSTGTASYRFANGLSGYYRWVSAPGAGTPVRVSRAVALTSAARVVAKAPASSLAHGRYLTVSGQVSAVPSPIVDIQYRYRGGVWHFGPRARVTGTTISGRIVLSGHTTAYTRLHVRPTVSYAGSLSSPHATSVR